MRAEPSAKIPRRRSRPKGHDELGDVFGGPLEQPEERIDGFHDHWLKLFRWLDLPGPDGSLGELLDRIDAEALERISELDCKISRSEIATVLTRDRGRGAIPRQAQDLFRLLAMIRDARKSLEAGKSDPMALFHIGRLVERARCRAVEPDVARDRRRATQDRKNLQARWADPESDRILAEKYDAVPRGQKMSFIADLAESEDVTFEAAQKRISRARSRARKRLNNS